MELLDNDDVETMAALYCLPERVNTESIQLFVELANVEPVENVTQLSQQYGVENPHIEVPRASVNRRSFVCGFDINLNVGCSDQYSSRLQIYPVVIETNALGEDGCNNDGFSDHKGEYFNDPYLDNVPDDINDEGPDDGNDHALLIGNPSCGIIIHKILGPICQSSIQMRRMLPSSPSTWT
ncbi:hypothetical protein GOBAR_AA13303 [Gossypium barbadense]|uniref:Uncharacterized protein n=1 Tax=Gossypium barbadense TaxID=3634 RepID=A0A2P5XVL2_GOSBA|nr:hypothetical protein GOBAR_AA13303 [Gossypium barbadense]